MSILGWMAVKQSFIIMASGVDGDLKAVDDFKFK